MELQKIDLTRYNDEQLKLLINMSWDMIALLAKGYKQPIGTLNLDLLEVMSPYMCQAANILFEHEMQKQF